MKKIILIGSVFILLTIFLVGCTGFSPPTIDGIRPQFSDSSDIVVLCSADITDGSSSLHLFATGMVVYDTEFHENWEDYRYKVNDFWRFGAFSSMSYRVKISDLNKGTTYHLRPVVDYCHGPSDTHYYVSGSDSTYTP